MQNARIETQLKLLLIDDEPVVHAGLGAILEDLGYQVAHAYDGEEGLRHYLEDGADILISDINMPDMDGLQLLGALRERDADVEVILITGLDDADTAVQALRHGAFDFFAKPFKSEELVASLQRTQRFNALRREKERIERELALLKNAKMPDNGMIVGSSKAMQEAMGLVAKVVQTERTTVLIQGESGTGKELVARAIHDQSARAGAPYMSINCTAIPENLFESELFGHEKGAFTDARSAKKGLFELANGGTLFLDEIGDMDLASQAKILRALEERKIRRVGGDCEIPIDIRLVAATNKPLDQMQREGSFRSDLYYRLNVFTIKLPELRARNDDALLLAEHFVRRYAKEFRKDVRGLDAEGRKAIKHYSFPGNVRELRNIMERAVILCEGPEIGVHELKDLSEIDIPAAENLPLELAELEKMAIARAMTETSGNQTQAAALLGIGDDALRYRLKKYEYAT